MTLNAVTSNKKPKGDSSAYVTPVQSPRGVAGGGLGLPSHISVFGDDQPDEDDAYMGGVRLPSHISAFGDGDEDDLACAVKGLKGTAHLHPPGAGSGFGVQHVAGAGEWRLCLYLALLAACWMWAYGTSQPFSACMSYGACSARKDSVVLWAAISLFLLLTGLHGSAHSSPFLPVMKVMA